MGKAKRPVCIYCRKPYKWKDGGAFLCTKCQAHLDQLKKAM